MRSRGAVPYGFISFVGIDSRDSFQDSVGYHRDGVITDHTIIVLAPQLPNRKITVIIILTHHTFDEIDTAGRLQ